jgi:hypothetical protein
MNDKKVEIYLNYLDKEMTIMGILSTFAIAVPAFVLERAFSAGSGFFYDLRTLGQNYLLTGSALMLLAAAAFYKQRSQLAWYYGQIALGVCLSNSFGCALKPVHRVLYLWNMREETHDEQNVPSLRTESTVFDATVTVRMASKRPYGSCAS